MNIEKQDKPLVSVIMPAFNMECYIEESINSIINQTYSPIELIIIDDGSTDNTKSVISKYGNKVQYVYQENSGPSAARNRGIEISRGSLIAYMDSDDIAFEDRIEMEVNYLLNNPQVAMVYGGQQIMHEKKNWYESKIEKHDNAKLLLRNYIPCSTVMHWKNVFSKIGYWNSNVDWDLWIRISEHFNIGYLDKVMVKYREHASGVSKVRGWRGNRLIDLRMFKDRYKRKKDLFVKIRIICILLELGLEKIFPFLFKQKLLLKIVTKLFNKIEKIIFVLYYNKTYE